MKKILILLCVLCIAKISVQGQNDSTKNANKKFGITFSGFINAQAAYDTRQTEGTRDNMCNLYPLNVSLDKNGKDINAHPGFNEYAMASRLAGTITGPDAFGAKAMAYMEGDFTGPSSSENDAFRLRHAYMKFTWPKAELLAGQYWHPLNLPEMIPYVLALNTGAPFHPYSRQPQLRFTRSFGKLNFVAVAASNRDYTSDGPAGVSYTYLKNSAIPNFDVQLQYKSNDKIFFGIGGDYKRITPRLKNDSNLVADESLDCYTATAFLKIKLKPITVKFQTVFGQNLYDQTMLGGYAVEKADTAKGSNIYTNLDQLTGWIDLSTNNKSKFNAGLFLGYAKNMGSQHNIWGEYYGRGTDIAYAYRVAPRVSYTSGNVTFAAELEYTDAAYGTPDSEDGVNNTKNVYNFRVLLFTQYNF
ncbi:MAG: hypothetical protein ABR968_02605 [Bacteroidales bacterium]|jgi:hypothetical protein